MRETVIPHSRPSLSESDSRAVLSVLKSGQLSQGPVVERFEKQLATYIGKREAAATSSGTSALHLALLALGVREGDEVVIPSFVCTAVLHAVAKAGATAVLADIDPVTFNISPSSVAKKITARTKAVVIPHMFGQPANLEELSGLGIPLIEDCAQSIGANYKGRRVGSMGTLSVFSFYATKVITSGEGGMVLSDSESHIAKVKDLRDYDHREDYVSRFNYKMTDIQAALGQSQLSRLGELLQRRREIVSLYFKEFKNGPFELPVDARDLSHIYFRFVVKFEKTGEAFQKHMKDRNIICLRPVHKPLHDYLHLNGFPITSDAWQKTLSIPLFPSLSDEEIERILSAVKEATGFY